MTVLLSSLLLVAAIVGGAAILAGETRRQRRDRTVLALLALFVPGTARARAEPRELLVWYPAAGIARRLFPEAFAELDAARGEPFPFTSGDVQDAHARVTSAWLAWEQAHDIEYRLKAADAERAVEGPDDAVGRGRLEAVEREKLERYQRSYEEYIRTARAIAALEASAGAGSARRS